LQRKLAAATPATPQQQRRRSSTAELKLSASAPTKPSPLLPMPRFALDVMCNDTPLITQMMTPLMIHSPE
jgi:hypothetical protein